MATAQAQARVLTSYYRPKPGGLCRRLFRSMQALLRSGCELHYLAVEQFPVEHPNCHFHRFPWPASKTDSLVFWLAFHALAPVILLYLGFRYRVTHTFAFSTNYAFCVQPLRILKGTPLSLFLRGDSSASYRLSNRGWWIRKLDRLIEAVAIHRVNVYAVSSSLLMQVVSRHRWAKPSTCTVLPNDLLPIPSATLRGGAGTIRLACVGRLDEGKNQGFVLRLLAELSANNAHLSIYGIGPRENYLKQLSARLGIQSRVSFMGWMDPDQIWPNVDLLLVSSLHEGASNALLEALAHGIPILASDIPGHRDMLANCELLPLENLSAWQRRINEILAQPADELRRLADKQQAASQWLRFNWDEAIYKCIVCQ